MPSPRNWSVPRWQPRAGARWRWKNCTWSPSGWTSSRPDRPAPLGQRTEPIVTAGLRLGAPGAYVAPVRDVGDGLQPVRLDVTGFVGVSLRGPVDFPVAVASWTDFVARFGGIINPASITPTDPEGRPGPGLLPYAVQAFFAQGGVKAWVSR